MWKVAFEPECPKEDTAEETDRGRIPGRHPRVVPVIGQRFERADRMGFGSVARGKKLQ
ncbi:MAG: hypothetical protein NC079_11290 [Clostridium sp.]|nr:hypothetical protein [Acetatifactor muris]MCM1528115.1 hypothetical protein [Bacteroides sp.]MCM1564174.1 hypothetical protein [Clostridium sp.]